MERDFAEAVHLKSVRLALLKACGLLMSSTLGAHPLCSTAVAQAVLTHYHIPATVVVGYIHMDLPDGTKYMEYSVPHVWLTTASTGPEGSDPDITDLTCQDKSRKCILLGSAVGFVEGALKAFYTFRPKYPLLPGAMTLDRLREAARDLNTYVSQGPAWIKAKVAEIVAEATNGKAELTLMQQPAVTDA